MELLPALLLLLLSTAGFSVNIVPKIDFDDGDGEKNESPGITPEYIRSILEKESHPEVKVSPGVVKAVLEVSVGGLPTKKPESKTGVEEKKKTNQVLICTLDGNCKLHTVESGDNSDEKEDDEESKNLKPIIVSDFDVDPSKEGNKDDGKKEGKGNSEVPVLVGWRGAVKDDGYSYYYPDGHHHQIDRLPVYYGMKLSPEFYSPNPTSHHTGSYPSSPPQHGYPYYPSYHDYPYEHGVSYLYPRDDNLYPISGFPEYGGSTQSYVSGASGPRTPTPYAKYHPVITPLHRRVGGGGDWYTRPGVHWPTQKHNNEMSTPEASDWMTSKNPSLHGFTSVPNEDSSAPGVIAVRGKMDDDSLTGRINPNDQSPPKRPGEITIDGKLGKPLDMSQS